MSTAKTFLSSHRGWFWGSKFCTFTAKVTGRHRSLLRGICVSPLQLLVNSPFFMYLQEVIGSLCQGRSRWCMCLTLHTERYASSVSTTKIAEFIIYVNFNYLCIESWFPPNKINPIKKSCQFFFFFLQEASINGPLLLSDVWSNITVYFHT